GIGQAGRGLTTAVLRRRLTLDLGKRDDRAPGECRAEVLRQIGHRLQIDDALAIDPRGKLPTAIAGGAELDREVFELGGQHSDEVPDGHRTKNNTVTGGPLRPSYQHQLFGGTPCGCSVFSSRSSLPRRSSRRRRWRKRAVAHSAALRARRW